MKYLKAWAPAAAWMVVIFVMSAMPGDISGTQSGRLLALVLRLVSLLFGEEAAAAIPPQTLHLLIRKAAHMTEYAILFYLDCRALRICGAKRPGLSALALCVMYAATDEWHQSFAQDRGPSVIDVGIDAVGAGLMWAMIALRGRMDRHGRT